MPRATPPQTQLLDRGQQLLGGQTVPACCVKPGSQHSWATAVPGQSLGKAGQKAAGMTGFIPLSHQAPTGTDTARRGGRSSLLVSGPL